MLGYVKKVGIGVCYRLWLIFIGWMLKYERWEII